MAFDKIIDEYNISKVRYIITDDAANMKRAFKVKLPQVERHSDDSDAEDGHLDDERPLQHLTIGLSYKFAFLHVLFLVCRWKQLKD